MWLWTLSLFTLLFTRPFYTVWKRYTEVIAKLSLWTRDLSLYLREWHGHWLCHFPPVSPWGQTTHLFEDGVIMAPDGAMGVTVVGKG